MVEVATGAPGLIGVARPRVDSEEKVRGATRFAADQRQFELLHARIVPSVYAHARIRGDRRVGRARDARRRRRPDRRGPADRRLRRHADVRAARPGRGAVRRSSDRPRHRRDRGRRRRRRRTHVVVDAERSAGRDRPRGGDDARTARSPGSPRSCSPRAARRRGERRAKSAHAAVGGEGAELLDEDLSANVVNRKRYTAGDAAAALGGLRRHGRGDVPHRTGSTRAISSRTRATAWLEPDGVLTVSTAHAGHLLRPQRSSPRSSACRSRKVRGQVRAARRVVRLEAPRRRSARGRRGPRARAGPSGWRSTRREDIAGTNPAPGASMEVRDRRRRRRPPDRPRRRGSSSTPAPTSEWSIEGIAAVLVGGPYRWDAFDVRAYGVRTNRFGTGSYRGPGGPQAAFAHRDRSSTSWPRELEPRPDRAASPQPRRRRRPDGRRRAVARTRAMRSVLEAARGAPDVAATARPCPPARASALALGVWPGGKAPAAALCRLNPDGIDHDHRPASST